MATFPTSNLLAGAGILGIVLIWLSFGTNRLGAATVNDGSPLVYVYAAAGGILPALLWLWFWLKEDARNPEPRSMIALSFIAGMLAVPLVIPFQSMVEQSALIHHITRTVTHLLVNLRILPSAMYDNTVIGSIFLWAAIEECAKFLMVYLVAIRSRHCDEPIDMLMYLIIGALGFAALENVLYMTTGLLYDGVLLSVFNIHMRFVGATLLHVIASGLVGTLLAITYQNGKHFWAIAAFGLMVATVLHTLFNLFIMSAQTIIQSFAVYSLFWLLALVLIFFFEKIKTINHAHTLVIPPAPYAPKR